MAPENNNNQNHRTIQQQYEANQPLQVASIQQQVDPSQQQQQQHYYANSYEHYAERAQDGADAPPEYHYDIQHFTEWTRNDCEPPRAEFQPELELAHNSYNKFDHQHHQHQQQHLHRPIGSPPGQMSFEACGMKPQQQQQQQQQQSLVSDRLVQPFSNSYANDVGSLAHQQHSFNSCNQQHSFACQQHHHQHTYQEQLQADQQQQQHHQASYDHHHQHAHFPPQQSAYETHHHADLNQQHQAYEHHHHHHHPHHQHQQQQQQQMAELQVSNSFHDQYAKEPLETYESEAIKFKRSPCSQTGDPAHLMLTPHENRARQPARIRRGRPRKRGGHLKNKISGKLWEFIRDLLLSDRTNPSFIRWERREDGVFKFVQSDKVAKMWGERKQNPKMTYEKLSRAMRYYYKSKVLLPVFGRRLVYKFGPNATGWLPASSPMCE